MRVETARLERAESAITGALSVLSRNCHAGVMNDKARGPATTSARVVVGVDGSSQSIAALRRASEMALESNADLEVVTSWSYPALLSTYDLGFAPNFQEIAESEQAKALATVFGENLPDWVHPLIVEGNAAHQLVERSRGAQLLVVGSRGLGGFKGLLLGSVSSECAAHAKSPVLVMREVED